MHPPSRPAASDIVTTVPPADAPSSRASLARRVCVAALIAATLAYFAWTTFISFESVPRIRSAELREGDHFNLLSRGFLKGQLHLDAEVPAELLAAPNPYDPKTRGPVPVIHDASLYQGKYYIYFGPAPVATLLLPFTALTGRDLHISHGVLFFTSIAFLALAATFLFVQRRHFPGASLWTISAGLIALDGAGMFVALLRRPHIWEFAGAAGLCYASLAFLCLVRAVHSRAATRWAALGGLALGLAVASRPTWLLSSVVFGVPLLLRTRQPSQPDHYTWRSLAAAAAACTTIVLGLLAYNHARFGDPFEFGQKYQLSSVVEGDMRHFSTSYIAPNFRIYFLSALRWLPTFPFHEGIAVPPLPPGHAGHEHTFGLLRNLPFASLALLVPLALVRRRCRDLEDKRKRTSLAIVVCVALLSAGFLLCFFGNCVRYMADFSPWIMLLAGWAVLAVETHLVSPIARRVVRSVAFATAVLSAGIAALAVMPLYHFEARPPKAYLPIARALNYPTFLVRDLRWPGHSPLEINLTFPANRSPRQEPLLTLTRGPLAAAELFVDYLGADRLRLGYRTAANRDAHYSPLIAPAVGERTTLQLSLGSYADYDGHVARLRVDLNGWPLWTDAIVPLAAFPGTPTVGSSPASPSQFTGEIHAQRSISTKDFTPPRLGGARLRIPLTADMAGRSFPLLTSGRAGAGDLLFLQVEADGRARLGYDHWADRLRHSSRLPTSFGRSHVFEFWIPPDTPPINARGDRELIVLLDGAVVWREPVPWYSAGPESRYLAANPIGGSTCEPQLPGAILEAAQLPFPQNPP